HAGAAVQVGLEDRDQAPIADCSTRTGERRADLGGVMRKVVINADAAHFASKLETALGTLERCYRVECRLRLVPQPHEHPESTGRVDGVVQPGDLQPGGI